jgi:AbiV family abortive infection protein
LKELTIKQLSEGRLKAIQNARSLIEDAECLLESNRWSSAAFLAHIAIEELGKYLILVGAVGRVLDGSISWSRFWKRFFSHEHKTQNIFNFDAFLSPSESPDEICEDFEKAKADSQKYQQQKISVLYVDFEKDAFVEPAKKVDENITKGIVEGGRSVLLFFEKVEREIFSKGDITSITQEKFRKVKEEFLMGSKDIFGTQQGDKS